MIRTQIYLTREEHKCLSRISAKTGKSQSELVRNAIDEFLDQKKNRLTYLRSARGLWKNRKDIPQLRKLRKAFDRQFKNP